MIRSIGNNMNLYTYNPTLARKMTRLATMKRINTAADDAAGLAISEKMITQYRGEDRAVRNVRDMQNLTNIAEGAMNSITDNLQRMRELTIQAKNPFYTEEDRGALQDEVDQLRSQINESTQNAEFNKMKLLDGSFKDKFVTMNANGAGARVTIEALDTKSLGLDKIDLRDEKSLENALNVIDNAQATVLEARSDLGAKFNRFSSAINNMNNSIENMKAADSRIAGLDYSGISDAINNINRGSILNSYKAFMQKQQMAMAGSFLSYMM